MSASAVMIHYEDALYQVYAPLPLPFNTKCRQILPYTPVTPGQNIVAASGHLEIKNCTEIYLSAPDAAGGAYSAPFTICPPLGKILRAPTCVCVCVCVYVCEDAGVSQRGAETSGQDRTRQRQQQATESAAV